MIYLENIAYINGLIWVHGPENKADNVSSFTHDTNTPVDQLMTIIFVKVNEPLAVADWKALGMKVNFVEDFSVRKNFFRVWAV